MKPAIVVVGSLNMDFVVSVEHLPAPGETVLGRDFQMFPGGKGANQACAAGKAGRQRGGRAHDRARGLRRLRRSSEGQPVGRGRGCQRRAWHRVAADRSGADLGGPRGTEFDRGGLRRESRAGGGRRGSHAARLSRRAAGAVSTGNAARYGGGRAGAGARGRAAHHSRSGARAAAGGRSCSNASIS